MNVQVREREEPGIIPKSLTLAEWRMVVWPSKVKFGLGSRWGHPGSDIQEQRDIYIHRDQWLSEKGSGPRLLIYREQNY